jgi:hypothetical protein
VPDRFEIAQIEMVFYDRAKPGWDIYPLAIRMTNNHQNEQDITKRALPLQHPEAPRMLERKTG